MLIDIIIVFCNLVKAIELFLVVNQVNHKCEIEKKNIVQK